MELTYNENRTFSIQDGGYKGGKKQYKPGWMLAALWTAGGIGLGLLLDKHSKDTSHAGTLAVGSIGLMVGVLRWMDIVMRKKSKMNLTTMDLVKMASKIIAARSKVNSSDDVTLDWTTGDVKTTHTTSVDRSTQDMLMKTGFSFDEPVTKHGISMFGLNGNIIMILNNPSNSLLKSLNEALDDICHRYHKADYKSIKQDKQYVVEFKCPGDNIDWMFLEYVIDRGMKINFITNFNQQTKYSKF